MIATALRRCVTTLGAVTLLAACTAGNDQPTDALVADPSMIDPASASTVAPDAFGEPTDPVVDPAVDAAQADVPTDRLGAMKQRCIDVAHTMERRIVEEGFEFPDEGEELSEEELETTLAPGFEIDDRVAPPDERPELAPMPTFDPESSPIPELDVLVGACFETGIVTEKEVFGDEAEEWCAELAEIPIEEVREFAEEEGADVVRREFEACGLSYPLES